MNIFSLTLKSFFAQSVYQSAQPFILNIQYCLNLEIVF